MQKTSFVRKSFIKLLPPALGYMVMGNLLATIMSISLAPFSTETAIMGLAVLFAMAIYLLLVAVPAYKNGMDENKNIESGSDLKIPKYRWVVIGLIEWGIMLIPSLVFLSVGYSIGVYRIILGAIQPLSLFLVNENGVMLSYSPYVFMGFYALTVPACHIGFILGAGDKLNKDRIMYKGGEKDG